MSMGAVKFLTKPLDFDALLAELRMYMTLPLDRHERTGMPQAALAP